MNNDGIAQGFNQLLEALEAAIVSYSDDNLIAEATGDLESKSRLEQKISWLEGFHTTLAHMEVSWAEGPPVPVAATHLPGYPPLRVLEDPEPPPDRKFGR